MSLLYGFGGQCIPTHSVLLLLPIFDQMHMYACLVLTVAYPFDLCWYPYTINRRLQGQFNEITRFTVRMSFSSANKLANLVTRFDRTTKAYELTQYFSYCRLNSLIFTNRSDSWLMVCNVTLCIIVYCTGGNGRVSGERSACPKLPCLPTAGSQTDYSNNFSHYHDHSMILMGIRFITWHTQTPVDPITNIPLKLRIQWFVMVWSCEWCRCYAFGLVTRQHLLVPWRWYSSKTVHFTHPWYCVLRIRQKRSIYPWEGFTV